MVAEYSLKDISKPIGVSEYKITSSLPDDLESTCRLLKIFRNGLNKKIVTKFLFDFFKSINIIIPERVAD